MKKGLLVRRPFFHGALLKTVIHLGYTKSIRSIQKQHVVLLLVYHFLVLPDKIGLAFRGERADAQCGPWFNHDLWKNIHLISASGIQIPFRQVQLFQSERAIPLASCPASQRSVRLC